MKEENEKIYISITLFMSHKVTVRFKPLGSLAYVSPHTVSVERERPFAHLVAFLRRKLAISSELWCYIGNAFQPDQSTSVGELWDLYQNEGQLLVIYSPVVAFG